MTHEWLHAKMSHFDWKELADVAPVIDPELCFCMFCGVVKTPENEAADCAERPRGFSSKPVLDRWGLYEDPTTHALSMQRQNGGAWLRVIDVEQKISFLLEALSMLAVKETDDPVSFAKETLISLGQWLDA